MIYGPAEMHVRMLRREDKENVRTILIETDVFKAGEIKVAMELVDVFLDQPDRNDYQMHVAVNNANEVIGYLCLGQTPITTGTFDLYWIAVRPAALRQGVGKNLLEFGENLLRSQGAKLLLAETSSQPKYVNARTFYLHNGYTEVAHIRNYYDEGDDLIIYAKYFRT